MRTYTTVSDQTIYDLTLQLFGKTDNMIEFIGNVIDINDKFPLGTELEVEDTTNQKAALFDAKDSRFTFGLLPNDIPIDPLDGIEYDIEFDIN